MTQAVLQEAISTFKTDLAIMANKKLFFLQLPDKPSFASNNEYHTHNLQALWNFFNSLEGIVKLFPTEQSEGIDGLRSPAIATLKLHLKPLFIAPDAKKINTLIDVVDEQSCKLASCIVLAMNSMSQSPNAVRLLGKLELGQLIGTKDLLQAKIDRFQKFNAIDPQALQTKLAADKGKLQAELTRLQDKNNSWLVMLGICSPCDDKIRVVENLMRLIDPSTSKSNLYVQLEDWKNDQFKTLHTQRNGIHQFFSPSHVPQSEQVVQEVLADLNI